MFGLQDDCVPMPTEWSESLLSTGTTRHEARAVVQGSRTTGGRSKLGDSSAIE